MKKILLVLIVSVIATTAFSQRMHLQLGVSAGLNARAYNIKVLALIVVINDTNVTQTDTTIKLKGTDGGYHIGCLFRVSKGRKYAETGLNFVRSSVPVFDDQNVDSLNSDSKKVYGVEIPFLVGYKVVNTALFKWRFSTGLNLGIIGKVKSNELGALKKDFTNPRVGMRFGTGIDLANITLDFYYTLGLTKEFKSLDIRSQSHFIQLSFGVLF